ncbi:MAG: tetratricopeptide repeat protein [Nostocales cyanobacterium 94392]|nr:tetratricopeptide repeat protein [Nostocales cyanobacterium 94392]
METFVLLHNELDNDIRGYLGRAKKDISKGNRIKWDWSCATTKGIKVGDKIFIQRAGKPGGYFAYGVAVAADKKRQLRETKDVRYQDFSEAYLKDCYRNGFVIWVEIHSVVDYNYPLEKKKLKELPEFTDVFLDFRRSGCKLKPDIAEALFREWEKHSMEFARKGFGKRLIDFYCELGNELKNLGKYEEAIHNFEIALQFDPKYGKAKNGIKMCK